MQKFSLFVIATCLCPFICFSQELRINVSDADPQVLFGIKQIKEKSRGKIIAPIQSVTIVLDSVKCDALVKANNWKAVKCFGDQCYSIRFDKSRKNIYILSGETTGAMYGALDIAEAVECNSLNQFVLFWFQVL